MSSEFYYDETGLLRCRATTRESRTGNDSSDDNEEEVCNGESEIGSDDNDDNGDSDDNGSDRPTLVDDSDSDSSDSSDSESGSESGSGSGNDSESNNSSESGNEQEGATGLGPFNFDMQGGLPPVATLTVALIVDMTDMSTMQAKNFYQHHIQSRTEELGLTKPKKVQSTTRARVGAVNEEVTRQWFDKVKEAKAMLLERSTYATDADKKLHEEMMEHFMFNLDEEGLRANFGEKKVITEAIKYIYIYDGFLLGGHC